jgi:hypothetical protein
MGMVDIFPLSLHCPFLYLLHDIESLRKLGIVKEYAVDRQYRVGVYLMFNNQLVVFACDNFFVANVDDDLSELLEAVRKECWDYQFEKVLELLPKVLKAAGLTELAELIKASHILLG